MWSLFRDGVLAIGGVPVALQLSGANAEWPLQSFDTQPYAKVPQHNYPFDFLSRPEYSIADVLRIFPF